MPPLQVEHGIPLWGWDTSRPHKDYWGVVCEGRSINPRGGESLHPGVLEFRLRFFGRSGLRYRWIGQKSLSCISNDWSWEIRFR